MEKEKKDLWWILWGIFVAFTVQVLYDGFGVFLGPLIQFYSGLVILLVFFLILGSYTIYILVKEKSNHKNKT